MAPRTEGLESVHPGRRVQEDITSFRRSGYTKNNMAKDYSTTNSYDVMSLNFVQLYPLLKNIS